MFAAAGYVALGRCYNFVLAAHLLPGSPGCVGCLRTSHGPKARGSTSFGGVGRGIACSRLVYRAARRSLFIQGGCNPWIQNLGKLVLPQLHLRALLPWLRRVQVPRRSRWSSHVLDQQTDEMEFIVAWDHESCPGSETNGRQPTGGLPGKEAALSKLGCRCGTSCLDTVFLWNGVTMAKSAWRAAQLMDLAMEGTQLLSIILLSLQ